MPRMKIFNALEEEAFASPPLFNSLERSKHFAIPAGLTELIADFRTPTNQACFLLQWGYFKARRRFSGKQFRPPDLEFAAARLGIPFNAIQPSTYDKQTAARHQQLILDFFGYRRFDADAKAELSGEIAALVSAHLRPKLILLEIIPLLARRKIALPSYNQLAHLIVAALKRRQQVLSKIIDTSLSAAQRLLLDALLEKEAAATEVPEPAQLQRYRLTLLKKSSQSTRPAKSKRIALISGNCKHSMATWSPSLRRSS